MASQVIVIDRLVAIQRLEELLKEKEKELDQWKKDSKTFKSRLKAWEKKAVAYIRKNGKFDDLDSLTPDYNYRQESYSLDFTVDADALIAAIGERPEEQREPTFFKKEWQRSQYVAPVDNVRNAIALYKLSTDKTVKVNTSTSWAGYLVS